MSTILYADDELAIQRAIKSLLGRKGHTVLTASSVDEACALLATNHVDGALIDIRLGADSGFDLYEWIDMHRPELRDHVAFVTGDLALEPEAQRTVDVYGRPVLTKPFDFSELERLVREWPAS